MATTNTPSLILVKENPSASSSDSSKKKIVRRLQAQVVCRHGDRSPITAQKDEAFWTKELIPPETMTQMAENVMVLREEGSTTHKANGRGPFGKLTGIGLQQMVDLGTLLREELESTSSDEVAKVDANGDTLYPCIWTPQQPLTPETVNVVSTGLERAIQSAQGLVMGLLPGDRRNGITIDARHANQQLLLPDPQPRNTQEQADLEDQLALRPHLQDKEDELLPLAIRVTKALHPLLAADAHEAQFGAKQVRRTQPHEESIEIEPLAWNQLGEITKCLSCRPGMLEKVGIAQEDHHAVVQHAAWRWFETFRHPRLAFLSMNGQCLKMLEIATNHDKEPPMTLYSAHDSTLIGLLCAFKLEQPVAWPEYGSFLMMELLEVTEGDTKELYIRFSLCGELLRLMWQEEGEPYDMMPLSTLMEKLKNEGKATEGMH